MRLIDADELYYEDVECTDGNTYLIVHSPEVDNADVFDLEAHDNVVISDFANKIKSHLSEVENSIIEQRNNPKTIANAQILTGMQMCIEDFLNWLSDNTSLS